MRELKEDFRPYAAPANIIAVFNRARNRNLPEAINDDFLRIAGVSENVFYRVTNALQFLGLIHEDGRPTETMQAISGATDTQYREILEKVIREAYRSEFNSVDPGQDPQKRIIDAFHPYKPRSQTTRMVMLFLGLCREAGIPVLDAPRERRMKEPQAKRSARTTAKINGVPQEKSTPLRGAVTETTPVSTSGGLLFGVTEDDVAVLDDDEFNTVWVALGKVARARARAKRQIPEAPSEIHETDEQESDVGEEER